MNKITEIVKSFATSLNPSEQELIKAEVRYEICSKCEHIKQNYIGETCNICGCIISKKIFSPRDPACPLEKW